MRRMYVKGFFLSLVSIYTLFFANVYAACDSSLPAVGTRDDVLIVVNDNSLDSCAVGSYYALKRGLGKNNIVHIKSPASYYLSWTEFKIMRDQIIAFMQKNTFNDPTVTPVNCPTSSESPRYCQQSMDQIRVQTKIKYLVTTRGVPSRVVVDGSTLLAKNGPTSIDNYLRHWLVNYYSRDVSFSSLKRAKAFSDGRGMRTVNPAIDDELIIGRIDGLDIASAKALVDRAMFAEENGIYGKLYGSKFGSTDGRAVWNNYAQPGKYVYGDVSTGWQYQHGIFGNIDNVINPAENAVRLEQNLSCLTHIDSAAGSTAGKSPQQCVVKLTRGADAPPGASWSRQPLVDNALVYLGSLDGQATNGSFTGLMNWRRNTSCSETLCKNTVDPATCKQNSSDVYKEINTQCAGVADGFIGYNFQSFPVSFLAVWPTGWYQTTADTEENWRHAGGGDINNMAFPDVVSGDSADGDGMSLWFKNTDEVSNPQCVSDITLTTLNNCTSARQIKSFVNSTVFPEKTYSTLQPQKYRISFKYKLTNVKSVPVSQLRFNVRLFVKETADKNFQVNYGLKYFNLVADVASHVLPEGSTNWVEVETFFTLDPLKHAAARSNCQSRAGCTKRVNAAFLSAAWNGSYDGIKIRLQTSGKFSGAIGIDDVQIQEVNSGTQLALTNPSFTQGHEQVAAGDHAANFLSRLNGTAFWGSMSHHQSNGHSFDKHPLETMLYFMRGLPLGDAVWFAEKYNSGVLYGDPLYSPIAVKFNYITENKYDFVLNSVGLSADAVNGNNSSIVSTTYAVDYCSGGDFIICDKNTSWQSANMTGTGGKRNISLGTLDTTSFVAGQITLRLAVTSNNVNTAMTQTFYDYYPIVVANQISDFDSDGVSDVVELQKGMNPTKSDTDGDGVSDADELALGTNPLVVDTDGDGLNDGTELRLGTDPLSDDTDRDGMPDGWEVTSRVLDPLINDAALDFDNDGLTNLQEFKYSTNPGLPDTDKDGINDGEEVANKTNPIQNKDRDLDGMSDDWEKIRGTKYYRDDSRDDPDGDGVSNYIEYHYLTLPQDKTSTPVVKTIYTNSLQGSDATGDGSLNNPYASLYSAMQVAKAGDTIQLAEGNYNEPGLFVFSKMVKIQGTANRKVTLNLDRLYVYQIKWGGFNGIQLNINNVFNFIIGRNMLLHNVELALSAPLLLNKDTRLILDHVLVTNKGTATAITSISLSAATRTELVITNSTISGFPIGVNWDKTSYLNITNSILDNTINLQGAYSFNVSSSLLSDGQFTKFTNNIGGKSMFVDAVNGNYHLLPSSPAIDTGGIYYKADKEPVGHRLNMGFYGNTAEAAIALDSDNDGMPDGWENAMGLNPSMVDNTLDLDGDGLVNGIEYKIGTLPGNKLSKNLLNYIFLNPNDFRGSLQAMSLKDNNFIWGGVFTRLNQFESKSTDMTTFSQGKTFYSLTPVSMASNVNGTDMPVNNWMAGYDFVIPHFRQNHTYYIYSAIGKTKVTIKTDVTQTVTIPRFKFITVSGGNLNNISAVIHSEFPVMVFHVANSSSGSVFDSYTVPPVSKEIFGILSRYVVLGALQDDTNITIYKSDGSKQSLLLNSSGRYIISADNTSSQGQGVAVRIVADKPIAAIQVADSDGIEATAFWEPMYFGRRYGFPINTQYVAVACKQTAIINLYDNGSIVDTQTCTANGNNPGKAYFGKSSNGINIKAGQYLISDTPVYLIYEASSTNDEKNLLGNM